VPQAYKILKDSTLNKEAVAGTVVYSCSGYDYGLARDDTAITGIEHASVTLKRSGGYPSFTIPLEDLEPCEAPPLEKLTEEHVKLTCRPGTGAETCRYLTMGAAGWSCEKHTSLADQLDQRVAKESMVARGDNCEGRALATYNC
jgi:hypothetical protein